MIAQAAFHPAGGYQAIAGHTFEHLARDFRIRANSSGNFL